MKPGLICALVTVSILAGCGGPQMAGVKGRVTWKGKGVSQALIVFAPVPRSEKDKEPGKPGTAYSDDQGNYSVSTYRNYDGALVGKHNVTVSLDDTNAARCKRKTELTLEVKPGSNQLDIELQ